MLLYCQGSNCPHLCLASLLPLIIMTTIIFIHTRDIAHWRQIVPIKNILMFRWCWSIMTQINSSFDCKYIKNDAGWPSTNAFLFAEICNIYQNKSTLHWELVKIGRWSKMLNIRSTIWWHFSTTLSGSFVPDWVTQAGGAGCDSIWRDSPICHQNDKYYTHSHTHYWYKYHREPLSPLSG